MLSTLSRMKGAFAVSDLIAKRLSTLQAGTRVSLTWPGGVSGCETAVGTVRNSAKIKLQIKTVYRVIPIAQGIHSVQADRGENII